MKRVGVTAILSVLLAAMPFAQTAPASEVFGEWELTTISPVGENTNTVEFKKDGDAVKAIAKSPQGERPYDSTAVEGNKVTLDRPAQRVVSLAPHVTELLFAAGGVMGFFEGGIDTRTPAHYHAMLIAVTLVFMTLYFALFLPLAGRRTARRKLRTAMYVLLGIEIGRAHV